MRHRTTRACSLVRGSKQEVALDLRLVSAPVARGLHAPAKEQSVENLAGGYLHTSLQEVSAFVVIMLVLIAHPSGLLGAAPVRRI